MTPLLFVAALLAGPPTPVSSSEQTFDALAARVTIGDRVRVEDPSGTRTAGRLTAISTESLTLQTVAGERRFPVAGVSAVAVRRTSAWWGALIGFAVGGVVGYFTDPTYHDWDLPALLGAGAGAAVGHFVPRMKVVYRAPVTRPR